MFSCYSDKQFSLIMLFTFSSDVDLATPVHDLNMHMTEL